MEKLRNSSQDLVDRVHVMRKFFTNTNCETCGCLLYNIFWTSKEGNVKVKMSFSKVPMKNPGRYFETFVKIVEPIGGQAQNTAFCSQRLVFEAEIFFFLNNFTFSALPQPSCGQVASQFRRGTWWAESTLAVSGSQGTTTTATTTATTTTRNLLGWNNIVPYVPCICIVVLLSPDYKYLEPWLLSTQYKCSAK